MKELLVKINKKSIKKNPNAGQTKTSVLVGIKATFDLKGELPNYFIDGENVIIEEIKNNNSLNWLKEYFPTLEYRGIFINPNNVQDLIDKCIKDKINIKYEITYNYTDITHLPEPIWFYKYRKTYVKCCNCKSKVSVDNIEHDYCDEVDVWYEKCPVCYSIGTFPTIKYEKIDDIVNKNLC